MWKQVCVLALVVGGCGQSKAQNCDTYAQKVADLSDPAPGTRPTVVQGGLRACENGRVSKTELACVDKAATREELLACTLGPMTPPKPPDAPPAPTNKVTLASAQNPGDFKTLDFDFNADQRDWYAELQKRVADCATEEVQTPGRFIVSVQFSPGEPAISLGGLPSPLSFCVKQALSLKHPSSVKNGPAEFYIDLGKK